MSKEILTEDDRKKRGRGTLDNPTGRFEAIEVVPEPDETDEDAPPIPTRYFRDTTRSIVTFNDSPDVGFDASINPYRGCEHGCIYCYARPTHEYLGLSAGLDFETKLFVKTDAPALLRKTLAARSWQPQPIVMSGVTDPYQPAERQFKLTRQCLEVLAEFGNPAGVITKNHLITRDIDILARLAAHDAACVLVSITTLDETLARRMEPRASTPAMRLNAIRELSQAGVPVAVIMGPVIPGLTDAEIDGILKRAAEAGARAAYYTLLRLPYGVKELFASWVDTHYPLKKTKVLHRIEDVRDGKLNDAEFGRRMAGQGPYADYIEKMFALAKRRHGLDAPLPRLSTAAFAHPAGKQLSLFP